MNTFPRDLEAVMKDHVLLSCISSCGRCRCCREGRYGQCQGGGGTILGQPIDAVPTQSVGISVAVGVSPGDTVVIFGAGPIGLAAIRSARMHSPLQIIVVDPVESRRAAATACGADRVLSPDDDLVAAVREVTGGHDPDVTIGTLTSRRPSTWTSN